MYVISISSLRQELTGAKSVKPIGPVTTNRALPTPGNCLISRHTLTANKNAFFAEALVRRVRYRRAFEICFLFCLVLFPFFLAFEMQ